jgi:hypothetical protein
MYHCQFKDLSRRFEYVGVQNPCILISQILLNKIPKFMQVLANEPRKDMHYFCKE